MELVNDRPEVLSHEEAQRIGSGPYHPQVHIEHGRLEADVDEDIAPLILALWTRGIETQMSCIGTWPEDENAQRWWRYIGQSPDDPAEVWIEFPEQDDLIAFLEVAAGEYNRDPESVYNRICCYRTSEAMRWFVDVGPPLDANVLWDDEGEVSGKAWPGRGPDLHLWSWSVRFPHSDFDTVLERATSQKTGSVGLR